MGEKNNIPSLFLGSWLRPSVIKFKLTGEKQTSLITGTYSSFICGFASYCFSYPWSAVIWKYWVEHSRSKSFINFKLCTILSSVRTSHESCSVLSRTWIFLVLSIPPLGTQDHLVITSVFIVSGGLTLMGPLFYLIITQMCKDMDVGNLFMPKRSHKVLPLSEKCESKEIIGWGC